jgi:hypothetical protein
MPCGKLKAISLWLQLCVLKKILQTKIISNPQRNQANGILTVGTIFFFLLKFMNFIYRKKSLILKTTCLKCHAGFLGVICLSLKIKKNPKTNAQVNPQWTQANGVLTNVFFYFLFFYENSYTLYT